MPHDIIYMWNLKTTNQKNKTKLIQNIWVIARGREWGLGNVDQKVQTSSFTRNKYRMVTTINNTVLHL